MVGRPAMGANFGGSVASISSDLRLLKVYWIALFAFLLFSHFTECLAAKAQDANAVDADTLALVLKGSDKGARLMRSGRGITRCDCVTDKGRYELRWSWSFKGDCIRAEYASRTPQTSGGQKAGVSEWGDNETLLLTPEMYVSYHPDRLYANIYDRHASVSSQRMHNPLDFLFQRNGQTLAQIVRRAGSAVTVRETELDGHRVFLVETPNENDPKITNSYWIDPSKAFVIIRMECRHSEGLYKYVQQVELTEIQPGVWFPVRSVGVDSHRASSSDEWVVYNRKTFTFESCAVNVDIDDGIFSPAQNIPIGTHVDDTRFSPPLVYKVGDVITSRPAAKAPPTPPKAPSRDANQVGQTALDEPRSSEKIALRILYAGDPGTARAKDFVAFLDRRFKEVKTVVLWTLEKNVPADFDVAILDYGSESPGPCPTLPREYARATVTVGVMGALICGQLGLKSGYE